MSPLILHILVPCWICIATYLDWSSPLYASRLSPCGPIGVFPRSVPKAVGCQLLFKIALGDSCETLARIEECLFLDISFTMHTADGLTIIKTVPLVL